LYDAMRARIDEHYAVVHDGIAMTTDAVFRRNLVVRDATGGKYGPDPNLSLVAVGGPALLNDILAEPRLVLF
jgi:hypothetical protein